MSGPSLQVIHCLICDDVRWEVANKETVVGIYTSGIAIPSVPWIVYACIWMTVIWSGSGDAVIEIRALDPRQVQIGETSGHATAIRQGAESSLTFRGLVLSIESEGTYTVQWRIGPYGAWQTMKTFPILIPKT